MSILSASLIVVLLLWLVTMAYLLRELAQADIKIAQWRAAYHGVLRDLVKAETDLTIQRMLHGGEIARLTDLIQDHDTN
jgi:cell division protein FtsB